MRDRLIDLVRESQQICFREKDCKECSGYGKGAECLYFQIADYLLENGVIVPPCKVGQTVYCIFRNPETLERYIAEKKVCEVSLHNKGFRVFISPVVSYLETAIGKTVFLTREEAERALKGGGEE